MGCIPEAVLIALEGHSPETAIKIAEGMPHICTFYHVLSVLSHLIDHSVSRTVH